MHIYIYCLYICNLIHIYRFIHSECIYIYIFRIFFNTHAVFIYFTIFKSICTHPYQSHAKNLKSSFMTRNAKVEVAVWKSISTSMTQTEFLTKSCAFVKINSAWFHFECVQLHARCYILEAYMHTRKNPCKHRCIRISMHPYIHAYLSLHVSNVFTLDTFAAAESTGELERLDLLGGRGIQSQHDLKSYGNNAWRPESQWWMRVLKNVPLWSTDSPDLSRWFKFHFWCFSPLWFKFHLCFWCRELITISLDLNPSFKKCQKDTNLPVLGRMNFESSTWSTSLTLIVNCIYIYIHMYFRHRFIQIQNNFIQWYDKFMIQFCSSTFPSIDRFHENSRIPRNKAVKMEEAI